MNFKGLACAVLLLPAASSAGGTVAVLSHGGGAYMEAFSAFKEIYGEIEYYDLSKGKPDLPAGTGTVVAFGGKAAEHKYPAGTSVVYCMAPGVFAKKMRQNGRTVKISLIPELGIILSTLKSVQPGLKRLTVFWMIPDFSPYAQTMKEEGARRGIAITMVRVTDGEGLPALLRSTMGEMDAFWLPPDPLIVTPENLAILRDFSWANAIPFYGSTRGMTREGAAVSVGASFREMGAAAAGAAQAIAAGEMTQEVIFPSKPAITVNPEAAKKCRLDLPRGLGEEAGALPQ